jgi:predicted ATPase
MLTDVNLFQFKRFKDEHIELFPLTLLTGINGMGKSSVVQSLLILRQSFDSGQLQNNGKLIIEDEKLANLISPEDMLCADANNTKVAITLEDENDNKATWAVKAEGKINTLPFEYENKQGDIYTSSLFADTFQYLDAERIGPRVDYDRLTVTRQHSPLGYRGEYVASRMLDAVNSNTDEVLLPKVILEGVSKKVYDQISFWISEIIYPGTKVSIEGSDASKVDIKYSFTEQPTKTFNPMNIGFGFSYALPVIVAILTAKPSSLLIVENPEAHLHPRGQSRMGRLLALAAESGLQIIVETHSDHLLNGIRVAVKKAELNSHKTQIHYFTNNPQNKAEEHKVSFAIEEDGSLERWPTGFFDEWDNMLTELIKDI